MFHSIRTTASFLLAVSLCAVPLSGTQAAWTLDEGKWFAADSVSYYNTDHFIDDSGQHNRQPRFSKWEWNGYYEYGWQDDLTVGANLFLHRLSADYTRYTPTSPTATHGTDANYGLADTEFFVRQRLWQGKWMGNDAVLSLQPLVKLPSWYSEGGNPRSGTDNFDTELRLRGGYNFALLDRTHFATLDLAYRKRFGEWRDQFKSDVTLGFQLNDAFTLLLQSFITQRLEGTARDTFVSGVVNDYDLMKAQASLVYRLTPATRIQIGGFTHAYARNTGDGEGVLFSLWRDF